jgi:hypothetical protein
MKTIKTFFAIAFSSLLYVACVSSESEMLKQARSIQDGIMTDAKILDSAMTAKLAIWNESRSAMAMDSTLSTDSVKMQAFMIAKEKIDYLSNLQSEMTDWKGNLKMLPTLKEMASGSENPFGENAKDQEILAEIKKSKESFNSLKLKADAAMK